MLYQVSVPIELETNLNVKQIFGLSECFANSFFPI